jgi:UDP-N-acetylmuramate--alanine ligase
MKQVDTYYFIGINGIGMSGLANMLVQKGCHVLGSDISDSIDIGKFKKNGIVAFNTHDKQRIQADMVVVRSSAINNKNEELMEAKNLGCNIIDRGVLLAQLASQFAEQIAIAGTHGKTTTAAILTEIYESADLNPSYFVGGGLAGKQHGNIQSKDIIITEVDESDGSFLEMKPNKAIITNIEAEHMDYYKSKSDLIQAFSAFISNVIQNNGQCIINIDDSNIKKIYKQLNNKSACITFGIESDESQICAKNIEYNWQGAQFTLVVNKNEVERIQLHLFGTHNVYNALSSIALAMANNISIKHIVNGLNSAQGAKRRLELKYQANKIMLFDDYAHHPTEIMTTIEGIFKSFSTNRIIVVFQPHRFSRLTHLFSQFSNAFSRSQKTYIMPVFNAGERQKENDKTSLDLVKEINKQGGDATECTAEDNLIQELNKTLKDDDIVILMGAGDITTCSKNIIPIIQNRGVSK